MKKTTDTPRPFAVMMTDEEFQEFHENQKKEQLLNDLLKASNKSFSVKSLHTKEGKEERKSPVLSGSLLGEVNPLEESHGLGISDEDWDAILEKASNFEASPIDDITRSELGAFRLEDGEIEDPTSFDKLFKKEQSMLAELMKDVTEQARAANNKLKDMTKKSSGYGGVSKTYPDLLNATNAVNKTRLDIVTRMADLKKTIADLNFKKMKEEGPENKDSKDIEIANGFFNNILGNRKEFIDASMSGLINPSDSVPYPYDTVPENNTVPETGELPPAHVNLEEPVPHRNVSRSITSPIMGYQGDYEEDDQDYSDPFGYIRNEDRDVDVCVQRYKDGRVEFVAVDKEGEGVYDYELPGEDLLLDLEFRIGSQFATDSEGRRYRIIDVDPDGIDISDILEDDE